MSQWLATLVIALSAQQGDVMTVYLYRPTEVACWQSIDAWAQSRRWTILVATCKEKNDG